MKDLTNHPTNKWHRGEISAQEYYNHLTKCLNTAISQQADASPSARIHEDLRWTIANIVDDMRRMRIQYSVQD